MMRLSSPVCRALCAGWVIAATGLATHAQAPATPPDAPVQRFSARADIVLVDVAVLDNRGRPVTDLTASDFTVSVAGRARAIESAQFVSSTATTKATKSDNPREAGISSNAEASSGRLLLIVADEANLRFGASKAVVRAAEGLLSRLAPGDLVGVSRFPDGGGVEFTTNRTRVIESLGQVTGRAQGRAGMSMRVYLAEAVDFERGGRSEWADALTRECGQPSPGGEYEICVTNMGAAANELLQTESNKARDTIRRLDELIKGLAAAQAPVNIVLISEALFLGRDPGLLTGMAAAAANARVTLSVVRPAPDMFSMADAGAPPKPNLDDAHRAGLEMLAGTLRGGFYPVSSNGASAFDRISTELSGYYLLGVAPVDEDRTGRERRLRVEVKRKGLTVRARPNFVIRDAVAEAPIDAPARLQRVLAAPLPTPGLPIKVATYNLTNDGDDRVRVLIAAEIGEGVPGGTNLDVGVLILDAKGQVVRSTAGPVPLSPVNPLASSPGLYLTSALLPPGDYSVRLGAVDTTGAAGSVHHPVAARLSALAGGLEMSDLVVAPTPGPGQTPRVSPSAIIADQRLAIVLEGRLADAARLARVAVRFEVAKNERGPALVKASATPHSNTTDTRRTFSGFLGVETVPAGEYVLRAVIADEGGRETTLIRPFRLEGEPGKRATAGAPTTTAGVPLPMPVLTVPRLAFKVVDVLRPELVRPFIADLQKRHPPAAAFQAVVDQAKDGIFPTGNIASQGQSAAMATFIGGLAALNAGRIPQATTLFQQTLKAAPTFVGVAFYLGACHAANGQDREAIGAWQMSLLMSEGAAGVYPVLVDALLRVGETKKALEFIEESPASWGGPTDRMRREAIAYSESGRYDEALPLVTSLIEAEPASPGLLFLGLQLLYRTHLDKGLSDEGRVRFKGWAKQYQDTKGPELGLVQAWLASLEP